MKYSEGQLSLFKAILSAEQEELHVILMNFLREYYAETDIIECDGSYIFARGQVAVLTVAHLDTVHTIKPQNADIFFDQEKGVLWSPKGIGGDDRCGVFIILNLILRGYRPYVAFTWDEEIGCKGAAKMVEDIDCREVDFALQFDRRGSKEAVFYELDNESFERYIEGFGFNTRVGSFSDISEICPSWDMAGVNVSAGYVNEHTSNELIYLEVLYDTLERACCILTDQENNPTYFNYEQKIYNYNAASYYNTRLCNKSCDNFYNLTSDSDWVPCNECYYKSWWEEEEEEYA